MSGGEKIGALPVTLAVLGPPAMTSFQSILRTIPLSALMPSKPGDRNLRPCDFTAAAARAQATKSAAGGAAAPVAEFKSVDPVLKSRQPIISWHQQSGARGKRGGPGGPYPSRGGMHKPDQGGGSSGPPHRGKRAGMRGSYNYQQSHLSYQRRPMRRAGEWATEIQSSWRLVESVNLVPLAKQSLAANEVSVDDFALEGNACLYDKRMDIVTARNRRELPPLAKPTVPRSEEYAEEKSLVGTQLRTLHDEKWLPMIEKMETSAPTAVKVVASSEVLSVLMTACNARFSWHLTVNVVDGVLIIDKAYDSAIDKIYMDETNREVNPLEDPTYEQTIADASNVNDRVQQAVVRAERPVKTFEPEGDLPSFSKAKPSKLYRYRIANLAAARPNKPSFSIAFRAEIDAVASPDMERPAFVNVRSLLEFVNTRSLLERPLKAKKSWASQGDQAGALLATELRNNDCLINRWIANSNLAGCEALKLVFVVKKQAAIKSHEVICVSTLTERTQIGTKANTRWAILRAMLETLAGQPDGQYAMVKEPGAHQVKVFATDEVVGSTTELPPVPEEDESVAVETTATSS